MKFDIKAVLEWGLIAVVFLSFIIWAGYTRPAQAQGYYEDDQGGVWMDPNAPVQPYERRPTPRYRDYRHPAPAYGGRDPDYYGDVDQQPDLIIYRGRGYRRY